MDEQLLEQLKTIKNLVEAAIILNNLGKEELLPTILELLYSESQDMVDEYCVVK